MPNGGCILNGGILTLNNSVVDKCYAGQDGGGIYNRGSGKVILNNSIVRNNFANRDCGGISDYGASVTIRRTTIVSNTAQTGNVGGLGAAGVAVTLTNSTVMNNTSPGNRGGLYNNVAMTLIHVSVIANTAHTGGQNRGGGGLYTNAGTANITDSIFSGNQALGDVRGGGISIAAGSTINLTNVTLNNNSGGSGGGGIESARTMTLTNVNLSANSAVIGGATSGGGIDNLGTATLTNVTLSANSAFGGGIIRNTGTAMLMNTIVANDPFGPNCLGSLGGNFNLSNDNSCGFGGGRDNVNNLMLGPLANNGGSTLTQMRLPGSAAIDNGTNTSCPASDQRAKPRPAGLACDVGAVERQAFDFPFQYLSLPLLRK